MSKQSCECAVYQSKQQQQKVVNVNTCFSFSYKFVLY